MENFVKHTAMFLLGFGVGYLVKQKLAEIELDEKIFDYQEKIAELSDELENLKAGKNAEGIIEDEDYTIQRSSLEGTYTERHNQIKRNYGAISNELYLENERRTTEEAANGSASKRDGPEEPPNNLIDLRFVDPSNVTKEELEALTADEDVDNMEDDDQEEFKPSDDSDIRYDETGYPDPYMITSIDFSETCDHFDKITLYYYTLDKTLVDEDETIMDDPNSLVGWESIDELQINSSSFARNEKINTDFEIIKVNKHFKEQIIDDED